VPRAQAFEGLHQKLEVLDDRLRRTRLAIGGEVDDIGEED
jgi:hypothetical protein